MAGILLEGNAVTDEERAAHEHAALELAAEVRLREARAELESAPWWGRMRARRVVRNSEAELEQVRAAAPPPVPTRTRLWD